MIEIFKSFLNKIKNYGSLIFNFLVRIFGFIKNLVSKKQEAPIKQFREPTTVFERVVARQKSKQKVFKYRYAVIVGIAAVLLSGLLVLGNYITVYNENLPRTFCDEILKGYEENKIEVFVENCTNLPKVLKDNKTLAEYFNLYLPKDKFTYYRVAADKSGEQKYIFKTGNLKIGEIIFKKQKNTARYGITKYNIKSFEIIPLVRYEFSTYSTFSLLINGNPLDEYLYQKYEDLHNFSSILETPITKNLYLIDDVNYVKEVKAVDADGSVFDIVSEFKDSTYNVTLKCEDKLPELTEYFNKFVLEYMHYTVKNSAKTEPVLEFIDERSFLYKKLEDYRIRNTQKYENERVENLKLENLTYYGSGYYTCDVFADYLTDENEETVTQSFKKSIYLHFSDGKYYIVDMVDLAEDSEQNQ